MSPILAALMSRLISNDQTSTSKKINGMVLILTLTVSTTASKERRKNSTVFGRLICQSPTTLRLPELLFTERQLEVDLKIVFYLNK